MKYLTVYVRKEGRAFELAISLIVRLIIVSIAIVLCVRLPDRITVWLTWQFVCPYLYIIRAIGYYTARERSLPSTELPHSIILNCIHIVENLLNGV